MNCPLVTKCDQQPDAKDVPLALEDGNPNSSSDLSSDSDSSSSSSEEDAPLWRTPLAHPTRTSRLQSCKRTLSQSSLPLHAARKDLLSTQKELSGAKAVIAEQRGEISNLKRAIQTLENQILSDADMISD